MPGQTLNSVHLVCSAGCQRLTRVLQSVTVSQLTVCTLAEFVLLAVFVLTVLGPNLATLNLACPATQFAVLFQQFSQWEMKNTDWQTEMQLHRIAVT
jgi:hypothetical protein